MHEKYKMKSERVEILVCVFECCILNAKNVLSWNKYRKMKCLCNRWVFVWNPYTLKEMVQFVHEVHPVFSIILSTFAHMLCGSNDDAMPSFYLFKFSCSAFQLQGHLAQNKSLNAWKIANEVRKGWNFSMWLWMVHIECKNSLELKKF